jgi:hypothetical protein
MFDWLTWERAIIAIATPLTFSVIFEIYDFFAKPLSEAGELVLDILDDDNIKPHLRYSTCPYNNTYQASTVLEKGALKAHFVIDFLARIRLKDRDITDNLTFKDWFFLKRKANKIYSSLNGNSVKKVTQAQQADFSNFIKGCKESGNG